MPLTRSRNENVPVSKQPRGRRAATSADPSFGTKTPHKRAPSPRRDSADLPRLTRARGACSAAGIATERLAAPPNDDWLALSSSISILCEADLMALDEDLQAVPWGAMNDQRSMTSPLMALGARARDAPLARHLQAVSALPVFFLSMKPCWPRLPRVVGVGVGRNRRRARALVCTLPPPTDLYAPSRAPPQPRRSS